MDGMTSKSNFRVRQKILTIALLAIACMLIACFPTATLILIKTYILVRRWIAKCDLRHLDFAQKCPQNVGKAICENEISKMFREHAPDPRRNTSSLRPNVLGAPNLG